MKSQHNFKVNSTFVLGLILIVFRCTLTCVMYVRLNAIRRISYGTASIFFSTGAGHGQICNATWCSMHPNEIDTLHRVCAWRSHKLDCRPPCPGPRRPIHPRRPGNWANTCHKICTKRRRGRHGAKGAATRRNRILLLNSK